MAGDKIGMSGRARIRITIGGQHEQAFTSVIETIKVDFSGKMTFIPVKFHYTIE